MATIPFSNDKNIRSVQINFWKCVATLISPDPSMPPVELAILTALVFKALHQEGIFDLPTPTAMVRYFTDMYLAGHIEIHDGVARVVDK